MEHKNSASGDRLGYRNRNTTPKSNTSELKPTFHDAPPSTCYGEFRQTFPPESPSFNKSQPKLTFDDKSSSNSHSKHTSQPLPEEPRPNLPPSHDNSKTSTRPGFVTRRSSYDHNLYKRDLYQRAYSYPGPNFRPDSSNSQNTSELLNTPVECHSFEDQSTGLSSPKLNPSLPSSQTQHGREISPSRELNLDDGKHITESFLFGDRSGKIMG
ncbi:hypothetical protein G9A89_015434 [Geosiphon pyriformis]|nr:hypothetical protein G9A89_015434 [Geosiphon pyriformis]